MYHQKQEKVERFKRIHEKEKGRQNLLSTVAIDTRETYKARNERERRYNGEGERERDNKGSSTLNDLIMLSSKSFHFKFTPSSILKSATIM